ncbi:zinc finger protein, putative [Talaromyces stipitatus ATCC 10500]|uniref:Zinc finger protein, putative n=1 Tax=Talaromyces stipitatus (strain ATCC 10500 / CBS 375.48 / QM 6759 / NRRL 1006) TaxID=441959 RepID=B8M0L7_TALSN|nr:zinc finger protein, putative [Talaromyces stipitatus ATCC 10500]EED21400.1 zinc finger protein, putative [Talaromyces stipitatus ATCC 10500]
MYDDYECETCYRTFGSQHAASQHMNALDHWAPRYSCETCPKQFFSESAAQKHMTATGHFENYCKDCKRKFINENNLRMHLNSKIHRGSQIPCPFCKVNYTSASGLTHHLERGACQNAPFLNREKILQIVRRQDPNGIITKKQIEWYKEQTTVYEVTSQAYNGSAWECYLCHREFNARQHLTQHLNSPVHKQQVYHCPNFKCPKEFVTLAALFNHLESETCAYMKFQSVQKHVHDIVTGRKMIGF